MAERKTPSLSEVLAAFTKEANEIFPAEAPMAITNTGHTELLTKAVPITVVNTVSSNTAIR